MARLTPARIVGILLTLVVLTSLLSVARAERRRAGGKPATPSGKWIGQDGHDLVGPHAVLAGNDCQDIHIVLSGLPPRREVVYAAVKGLGGDEWQYQGGAGAWMVALVRKPGSSTADLFFEPTKPEAGRGFEIHLRFDDSSTANFWVQGGKADPNLRMPQAALKVRWVGQDGQDQTGPGPAVGPDGIQDIHLALDRLSPKVQVKAIAISAPGGTSWQFGLNPQGVDNAELVRKAEEPARADLFLSPDRDRKGQTWTVTVTYADGKADRAEVVAGHANPALRVPKPVMAGLSPNAITARWVGQDAGGSGLVRVALGHLPAGQAVAAAVLSDAVQGTWAYKESDRVQFDPEPFARPLELRRAEDGIEIAFPPYRDESTAAMTLRLLFQDGRATAVRFPGGPCDPTRRAPARATTTVDAQPGNDLNDLANRFGTVRLARGDYHMDRPLVLNRPVAIVGVPGARLVFAQGKGEPPWSAAIKVHAGHTLLDGFAVRFAGPVRWAQGVDNGPAVIGSTDNQDRGHTDPMVEIAITHMDLESPPAASPSEEAPRLIRLVTASSGQIEGNILKGGITELARGPWRVVDNDHRGTVPGTYTFAIFSIHDPHDLVVRKNRARPLGPSGKTWRFLVLTGGGSGDRIEGNTVEGVGPRDGDPGPNVNAPEIVLTESYRLHYEGKPAGVSPDGRVLQIPAPQGDPAHTGDVVAVLSGPRAGQWARIAQAIDARTYLMDPALPARGDYAVSIATGFVGETFRGNTIDARGSSVAAPMVLVGNHFGTKVLKNRLLGGGEAFRITAAPTESPGPWGWSHAPVLGAQIEGNLIEDAGRGATLTVEHSANIKTSQGRVYMTATVKGNAFHWTGPFLARRNPAELAGLTIGDAGALDLGELVVAEQGTRAEGPSGARRIEPLRVHAGQVNGRPMRDGKVVAVKDRTAR